MSIQLPNKFLQDPDWHLVEEAILEAMESVSFKPTATTAPTDFKAQVLANIRIKQAMETFLVQAAVIKQTETEKNPFA